MQITKIGKKPIKTANYTHTGYHPQIHRDDRSLRGNIPLNQTPKIPSNNAPKSPIDKKPNVYIQANP